MGSFAVLPPSSTTVSPVRKLDLSPDHPASKIRSALHEDTALA